MIPCFISTPFFGVNLDFKAGLDSLIFFFFSELYGKLQLDHLVLSFCTQHFGLCF